MTQQGPQAPQYADRVRRLMRDLRMLAGCESLLSALPEGQSVDDVLLLTVRHADSAADTAREIQTERRVSRQGGAR